MPAPLPSLTLLLLTSDAARAERLIARLREIGLAARAMVTSRVDRLDEVLARRAFDIILWWSADGEVGQEAVVSSLSEGPAEIPLIIVTGAEASADDLATARRTGARDLVPGGKDEQLEWVIEREAADLLQRRRCRELGARLVRSERRARELVDRTGDAIAFVDADLHLYANHAYLRLLGYQAVEELQLVSFLDLVDPGQRVVVQDLLRAASRPDQSDPLEASARLYPPQAHGFEAHLSAAQSLHDGRQCLRLIVTPKTRATEPSPLTLTTGEPDIGAAGRSTLFSQIEARLGAERVVEAPFTLFFIHVLQHAGLVQDLGLARALELVDGLGSALQPMVAESGCVARVSDDGFAMIIDGIDEEAAEETAERIRATARLPGRAEEAARNEADCQLGYVMVQGRAAPAEEILNAAYRVAMDASTAPIGDSLAPRPPPSLAARVKQETDEDDVQLAEKVAYALRQDQLKLVYQPIVSLMGDNHENYSVLVRLLDEEAGLLGANDFIGAAIRTGFVLDVDHWAIRSAIRILAEERRAGRNLRLFINLAEDTFRHPSIVPYICDCLRELDARGNWLAFQFQEQLVADNLGNLAKIVDELRHIKCRIAINRFGATQRPEMILEALPVDFVMLMPDYAYGLADDQAKQQRVLALANLAREFNVKSVVTGVEDAQTLTVLWTAGVDYVQGNFLQRPSPSLHIDP